VRSTVAAVIAAFVGLSVAVSQSAAQSRPLVAPAAAAIYQRLLPQIERIKLLDHHAHPAIAGDADVDIAPPPPGSTPLRLRDDNPELIAAAKALFNFPFEDLSGEHARWLIDKKAALHKASPGPTYFNDILDRIGIETSMANRVAMADYLDPARFKWVFFVDCFMFPFDNSAIVARNPDEAAYMPLQTKLLQRYEQQVGQRGLPERLSEYVDFVKQVIDDNKRRGAVAVKFEASYFRSLAVGDPAMGAVEPIYAKYHRGGVPTDAEYKTFQDFIFRRTAAIAGDARLPVHIHSSVGGGDYFNLRGVNVLNLEPLLRDPHYLTVTWVLIHGGYPFDREAILMAAMKNVYLDSSEVELMLYPTEFKEMLKRWFELYPDKVTFGTDAFPYGDALGVEEAYWLGVRTARTALAAALAEMVAAREISEPRAMAVAHAYLHDTAASLYR
jgi:predicted TIM-barrel fold metal-dependent hydrolase